MAIEIGIRIIGETTAAVAQELQAFAAYLSMGSGVGAHIADTPDTPVATLEKANGADMPTKAVRGKKAATAPAGGSLKAVLDRVAIIDGLTKIYSKGDEDVRLAITKFRDGQGADRLRDLKDDALPAAAELLSELRTATAAASPQV